MRYDSYSPFIPFELVVAHLQIAKRNECLVTFRPEIVHFSLHSGDGGGVLLLLLHRLGAPVVLLHLQPTDAIPQLLLLGLGRLQLSLQLLLKLAR